jgi:hypothetical protein
MMRAALFSAMVAFVLVSARADANVSPSCLGASLPNTPLSPTFSFDSKGNSAGDKVHFEAWRQPCIDGSGQSAVLVRMTPLAGDELICSANWAVVQNGIRIEMAPRLNPLGESFCTVVTTPATIIVVVPDSGQSTAFDESAAFTLIHKSISGTSQVAVPPAGRQPPSIQIIAKGCTACQVGFLAGFSARVTNRGGDVPLTLRGGVRFPDGTVFGWLSDDLLFPAGHEAEFDMFSGPIPDKIPAGTYVLEAAILESTFGATISRHVILVTLTP